MRKLIDFTLNAVVVLLASGLVAVLCTALKTQ